MRKIQKEYQIYTFEELKPEAQVKALADYRYINVEYFDWYHYVFETWEAKLKELGIELDEIFFSGFGSQGDGASFIGTVLPKYFRQFFSQKILKLMDCGLLDIDIRIKRSNSNYVHWNTIGVEVDYDLDEVLDRDIVNLYLDASLESDLNTEIRKLCQELYRDLESDYEMHTCDDTIKEYLIDTDVEFLPNGSTFIA